MTNSGDLLKRINVTRSLRDLPTLILAFGCSVTAGISTAYRGREGELVKNLTDYAADAAAVGRCSTLRAARQYLAGRGYGWPKKAVRP